MSAKTVAGICREWEELHQRKKQAKELEYALSVVAICSAHGLTRAEREAKLALLDGEYHASPKPVARRTPPEPASAHAVHIYEPSLTCWTTVDKPPTAEQLEELRRAPVRMPRWLALQLQVLWPSGELEFTWRRSLAEARL